MRPENFTTQIAEATGREQAEASTELGLTGGALAIWRDRRLVAKIVVAGTLMFAAIALLIPKKYASSVQLMPPQGQGANGLGLLSGLAGGQLLGPLAGDLLGIRSTGDLVVGVLQSRTVADRLIDQFDLRKVYGVKTYESARKKLADRSEISIDNKTEIVSVRVLDSDPKRVQAMAAEYVEALNDVMASVNTSAARRERVFLEDRIKVVKQSLDEASQRLAEYSSKSGTLDPKDEGRTMVEAAARLQGDLISAESQLSGLRQIYGDQNSKVRQAEALVARLRSELARVSGTPISDIRNVEGTAEAPSAYPAIRKLPFLGNTWLALYREATIQEAVYESLTKQYELARVQEAKETPSVKVLDAPDYPEKKSSPPRTAIVLIGAMLSLCFGCVYVLAVQWWRLLPGDTPLKKLWDGISPDVVTVRKRLPRSQEKLI